MRPIVKSNGELKSDARPHVFRVVAPVRICGIAGNRRDAAALSAHSIVRAAGGEKRKGVIRGLAGAAIRDFGRHAGGRGRRSGARHSAIHPSIAGGAALLSAQRPPAGSRFHEPCGGRAAEAVRGGGGHEHAALTQPGVTPRAATPAGASARPARSGRQGPPAGTASTGVAVRDPRRSAIPHSRSRESPAAWARPA